MKQLQKTILFSLLIVYSLLICVLGTIGHVHDIDGSFHDNCPACQWELQVQNENTILTTIWDIIDNPIHDSNFRFSQEANPHVNQIYLSNILSRAPPLV